MLQHALREHLVEGFDSHDSRLRLDKDVRLLPYRLARSWPREPLCAENMQGLPDVCCCAQWNSADADAEVIGGSPFPPCSIQHLPAQRGPPTVNHTICPVFNEE